ncbi:MAG: hypothetical protein BGO98_11450 [Myxococcales bacterium 68-20]|nr:MAG: hypothetical protein BGO98_11450 [Myxococcales bacterium 68-20]
MDGSSASDLDQSRRRRLGQLRARLVAVSLRSRSLRLTRTTQSGALDLHRLHAIDAPAFERILAMLGREGAAGVALCDVEPARDARAFTHDVAALAHASAMAWSETGTRDLAVGWPFLEGRTKDGTWIRAPLLLYPVKLGMTSTGRLSWMLEPLGPPELNESLAHALVRLASVKLTIDGMLAHDDDGRFQCDEPTWAGIVRYLESVGFELDAPRPGAFPDFERVEPRLRDDRDRAPLGAFALRSHLVLGRFPRSDSSIVADYDELLAGPTLVGPHGDEDERLGVAARLLEVDDAGSSGPIRTTSAKSAPTAGDTLAWRVFPSDDSQDEALASAGEGAVVVQGPPGTGKSQMIANLLAAAVAEGKRVLVVCQKRAALDVVADRLASVGLREPIAIVYDVQRDRTEVCEGVARTLGELGGSSAGAGDGEVARDIEHRTREHTRVLGRLSARLEAAQSAFSVMAGDGSKPGLARLLERSLDDDGRPLPELGELAAEATEDGAHELVPTIELLARETIALAAPHPIANRGDWSGLRTADLEGVFERVRNLRDLLRELDALPRGSLTPLAASQRSALWDEASVLLDPIERNDREELRTFLLGWVWTGGHVVHGEWQKVMERLKRARKKLEEAPPELVLEKRTRLDAWIADLTRLEHLESLWYRFFLPRWWSLRKRPDEVLALCKGLMSLTPAEDRSLAAAARRLCERAIPWQELIDELPVDNALFDFGLRGELADLDDAISVLETHHARTRAVHTLAKELRGLGGDFGALPDLEREAPETIGEQPFLLGAVTERRRGRLYVEVEAAARALSGDLAKTFLDSVVGSAACGRTVEARERIEALADAEKVGMEAVRLDDRTRDLPAWTRAFLREWRPREDSAVPIGAGDDALLALERAWIALGRSGRTAAQIEAALVDPDLLEQLSRDLDGCLDAAGRGVLARYRQRVLETMSDRKRGIAVRKLAAEVAKKRNRATMRQLVERHWDDGLSSVRPIWFCSPESVASLFPLRADLFDLVVLDEASQCPVEAALPALARSRRALVAGDDQQMPPTHFFRANVDDEEQEGDDEDAGELTVLATSSILGLARVAFPGTVLRWHYRSRHEELVAFSNAAFYGGRLITAPQADRRAPARSEGLSWVRVPGLWQEQTNELEAERVVDIVAELLLASDVSGEPPSIGVIAFNKKQADLVNELLDRRMSHSDAFRRACERDRARSVVEQLFVRNLENVQGDERDVIILSLAYGPSEAGGRVHARFGPLGLEGGEKRLNVAVTRARCGLVVVTSVEPEDLDVSGSKHVGPKLLRAYLELVRAHASGRAAEVDRLLVHAGELGGGKGVVGGRRHGASDARVGERICSELDAALVARGLRTKRGLGLGHGKLDLAVGRADEERWRLGVDCSDFLGEGDALRRDVYGPRFWERLGWRVLRVSPGMWVEDRAAVVERIARIVDDRS